MADPIKVNPQAIIKSIEEQYNYLLATGVSDVGVFQRLQAYAAGWASQWQAELDGLGREGAPIQLGRKLR